MDRLLDFQMSPSVFVFCVGLIPVLLAAYKYWKRSHVKVNCWFCNLNDFIPIKCQDGWMCSHCQQYNGFKPDGDFNQEIPAQWDASLNGLPSHCKRSPSSMKPPVNGLCQDCNRNQEMKVAQLASFQPINPDNFDFEIESFSYHLERAFRLCPPCEMVLEETLAHKKTLVLDMNLQMTGKRSKDSSSSKRRLGRSSALFTMAITVSLTLYMLSKLSTEHVMAMFSFNVNGYGMDVQRELPVSSKPSPIEYFLPPMSCPKTEYIVSPTVSKQFGSLEAFLELVGLYTVPLCVSGLALQGASSWHSGRKSGLLLWVAFAGTVLFQHHQAEITDNIQSAKVLQVILAFLILIFSWLEVDYMKLKPVSSAKRPLQRASSNTSKRETDRSLEAIGTISASRPQGSSIFKNIIPLANEETRSGDKHTCDSLPLSAPNYLTLPVQSSGPIIPHGTVSCSSVAGDSVCSPTLDVRSSASQEDNRSDASVDSAFSNPDSFTLDAADSINTSYQYSVSRKSDSPDEDVHSLIEGLSIRPRTRSQRQKNTSLFKPRQYGKDLKKNSVLTPAKLTNIMNDSMRSGIWSNSKSETQVIPTPGIAALRKTVSRPSSPSGSVHSHSTIQSERTVQSFSPPPSFRNGSPTWNSNSSPNTLSVCVSPNPLGGNPSFGTIGPSFPGSPMSQVIYTPYGLYHQMVSPPMYMMSPQPSAFGHPSPLSSPGSQFSPRSFCSSSVRDVNSFESDTDYDVNASPKSSRGRRTKILLSSSFVESVWQSRYAIMYTTVCYVLLGSMVGAFFYRGLLGNMYSKLVYGV